MGYNYMNKNIGENKMYKSLNIQGFRGISSLETDNLGKINLIVGENSSGKTSFLESLFVLTGIMNTALFFNINSFRGVNYISPNIWQTFFYNLDTDKEIVISGEVRGLNAKLNEERTLKIQPYVYKEPLKIKDGMVEKKLNYSNGEIMELNEIIGLKLEVIKKDGNKNRKTYISELYVSNGKFKNNISQNYVETQRGVFIFSDYKTQDLTERLDKILRAKNKDAVISILQKLDSKISDISIGKNNTINCDIGLKNLVPLNVLGDGLSRILAVVLAIMDVENGCVFIDEIENGFHYKTLEHLWIAIFELANQYNVQIFATTHSYECIKSATQSASNSDFKLFRIEKDDDGSTNLISFNKDEIQNFIDSDWEIR